MQIRPLHITLAAIAAAIIIGSLGYLIVYGDGGWRELDAKQRELADIKDENQQIENENIRIYRKIDRLKNDPEYIENTARQELKLIGEDEIVFTIKQSE
ncbi:MAG: septum formation initiator family protein [Desulfobacteraceae bacterium]|nr:MAG: septum formation initiator family protein [Desulfobacteraceae bacterium]